MTPNPEVMPSAGEKDRGDCHSECPDPVENQRTLLHELDHQSSEERWNQQQAGSLGQHCRTDTDSKREKWQTRFALALQRP